jgi:hypothetical protein
MLAVVMGGHLLLLREGVRECSVYEGILLERLRSTKVGAPEAILIRKELQEYLAGKTSECADAEADYAAFADKYLAVFLAMLGAGGAVAIARKD